MARRLLMALSVFSVLALGRAQYTGAGDDDKPAQPLKVCLVSGSAEYKSDASFTALKDYLEKHYRVQCTLLKARGFDELPGLEALDDCDVALFFTRRLKIEGESLERVKTYCLSGKPIVALRTASHGFQNWLEFDKRVLGGNYQNHHPDGPLTTVRIATKHPIFEGVEPTMKSVGSLYKTSPLAEDCTVLMTGSIPGAQEEPVLWTRTFRGARVVYTSLGHPRDFEEPSFRRLLANALFWAAQRKVPPAGQGGASAPHGF